LKLYHEAGLRGFVFPQDKKQAGRVPQREANVPIRKRNYIKTGRTSHTVNRKKMFIVGGTLLSVYLLVSFLFGDMGFVKYYRMKAQYNTLTDEIVKLKQDNVRLRKEVYLLRSDPAYLERIARDKLGLARPGEIVYYYGEP
jgi:cell division protein FtsB